MYKLISVLGSVVFLGIYLIWNQQAWTSQVEDLKLENQRLIEEIEILKVTFRPGTRVPRGPAHVSFILRNSGFFESWGSTESIDWRDCPKLESRHGNMFCVLVIIYLFRKKNLDLGKRMRNSRWKLEDFQKKRP